MNFDNVNQAFVQLVQELHKNEAVEVLTLAYPPTTEKADSANLEKSKLPLGLVQYFEAVNGFRLHWQNRVQNRTLITGSLALLPANEVTKKWNKAVYFGDASRAATQAFYPIDQFADEACCGVFGEGSNGHMHYYTFSGGEDPYDLQLSIEQYITTAMAAKCYTYWPLILKHIMEKVESTLVQKMSDDMAVLFPRFNMEKWVAEYQKLIGKRQLV